MKSLYFSVAWRQWRGSRSGLALLVICLVLASASLGLVGMLGDSVRAGIERDGRKILGGDIALTLVQRQAETEELAYIEKSSARVSRVTTLSTMARNEENTEESLVSLKAVDASYPLVGQLEVGDVAFNAEELGFLLLKQGVVVQQVLLDRLGLEVGDTIRLGTAVLEIRGVMGVEPDPSFGVMVFGPKIIISQKTLADTGLVQPGSLVRFHYRIEMPENQDVETWRSEFKQEFGDSGWRIRDYRNPMSNARDGLDRTWMFLSLSTLITVLSAGIGISNGVRRFLQTHIQSIAALRVVGATQREIQAIYGILLGAVTLGSIAVGLAIAGGLLLVILPLLKDILPIALEAHITPWAIFYTLSNGFLVVAVFALLIVTSAAAVNPGILFRQGQYALTFKKPKTTEILAFSSLVTGFILLNTVFSEQPLIAIIFIFSSIILLGLLWLAGRFLTQISKRFSAKVFILRYVLGNLSRPGAITGQVIVSLGLGLSVLVLINSLETNITSRIDGILENEAPSFYFIDIQPNQLETFRETVAPFENKLTTTAMLRGRITHLAGVPVSELPKNEEFDWITRGDRAFTWSADWTGANAESAPIVEGQWWPEDYNGPLLVSFDHDAAKSFGLEIGDKVGMNILGRGFEAEIASLRKIDWQNLSMNFVMVLSPGQISGAPHTHIATVHTAPERETALQKAVVSALPNVSALRLKDIMTKVSELLGNLVLTIRSIGAVSVAVGIIVLISALIAVQNQKAYENQVLRVVGADRRTLFRIVALELLVLGSFAAIIAAFAGNAIAWGIVHFGLRSDFVLDVSGALGILALGQGLTLAMGLFIAWRDLAQPQAQQLRNE